MGDTTTYIDARPQEAYAELTKAIDGVRPGPLAVGEQFRVPSRRVSRSDRCSTT